MDPHQQTHCVIKAEESPQAEGTGDRSMDPEKGAKNTGNGKVPGKYVRSSMKFITQE